MRKVENKIICDRCSMKRPDRMISVVRIPDIPIFVCRYGLCHVGDNEIAQQIHTEQERRTQLA